MELSERLGREPQGMLRLGLVHYNTIDEVDRTLAALAGLVGHAG
jgi:selenocysteine lyase/cysteine desulfurase